MRGFWLLGIALLLSSCKPHVRQDSGLSATVDKGLTLKLVVKRDDPSLATLVVCSAQENISSEHYAAHSLYTDDKALCLYALYDAREPNSSYYFINPRQMTAVGKTSLPGKSWRRLLLSGVAITGIATVFYTTILSKKLLQKITKLEKARDNMLAYSDMKMADSKIDREVVSKFRNRLNDVVGELPDVKLREELQKALNNEDFYQAIESTLSEVSSMQKDASRNRLLMWGSLLGIGAASSVAFVDELRGGTQSQRKDSPLEELFAYEDAVTVSYDELWRTLKLLNSHLPVRINPDIIDLRQMPATRRQIPDNQRPVPTTQPQDPQDALDDIPLDE